MEYKRNRLLLAFIFQKFLWLVKPNKNGTVENLKIAFSVFNSESLHFSSSSALAPNALATDDGFKILEGFNRQVTPKSIGSNRKLNRK